MEKIGIFYGSNTGKTAAIAEEIEFNLRKDNYEVINVADGIEKMLEFKNLILLTPTYGVGEVQEDWANVMPQFEKIDFTGKRVAVVGLGNQFVGLAIDENNQDDETPERVIEWVSELKKEFY